jgi:hypothetical protein
MKHYTEEDLILQRYGEHDDGEAIERHLAGCKRCRTEYEALGGVLAAVDEAPVPARGEAYPAEVWRRIESRVPGRGGAWWRAWLTTPRLALAGSVALLLVIAFMTGHVVGTRNGGERLAGDVRERILLVAVGDHLERSQRLLIELVNTDVAGAIDVSQSQPLARTLAANNRVFRRSASSAGEKAIAGVLDDLERVLLELANGPDSLDAAELADLKRQIEGRGLLIKIRVLGGDARDRGRRPAKGSRADQT